MSIAEKLITIAENEQKVFEAGQKSMVDESKIIEATAEGRNSVTINDVSEIKHKIKVTLDPYIEPGGDMRTLTVTRNGEEVETYEMWAFGTIEIDSSSPNMTFEIDGSIDIIVNYQKSWGIQQGRKQEYDTFWGYFQNYGRTQNYQYAFAYDRFDDTTYNPKYPIKCSNGSTASRYIYYSATGITDTKVEIIANSESAEYMFYGCSNLKTIRKLTLTAATKLGTYVFSGCTSLENIEIGGEIGKTVTLAACSELSEASIYSIINALSKTVTGQTLTLNKTAVKNVFGTNYDDSTDWTTLKNTKSNWTITLS